MTNILSYLIGLLFGAGLAVSQMINPDKVQNFLNISGHWDPSLLFVMFGALSVVFIGYRLVLRNSTPKLAPQFLLPEKKNIDIRLIAGAVVFGIGWGLSGYCPGPAITALGLGRSDPLYFIIGLVAGSLAVYLAEFYIHRKRKPRH